MKTGKATIHYMGDRGIMIYIPKGVAFDSAFPFPQVPGQKSRHARVRINNGDKRLVIEGCE